MVGREADDGDGDMNIKKALDDLQRTVDDQVADAASMLGMQGMPGMAALTTPSLGRPRDRTRDPVILECALDVLAEMGYEAMTIEMVATRARAGKATLYRRWPSKAHLVVDAIGCVPTFDGDASHVPDTGSLRGDLLAVLEGSGLEEEDRTNRVVAGLFGLFPQEPGLAQIVRERILEPRTALLRALLERAQDRGEVPPDRDLDAIALTIPSTAVYQRMFLNEPLTREFVVRIVDGLMLPAAGVVPGRWVPVPGSDAGAEPDAGDVPGNWVAVPQPGAGAASDANPAGPDA